MMAIVAIAAITPSARAAITPRMMLATKIDEAMLYGVCLCVCAIWFGFTNSPVHTRRFEMPSMCIRLYVFFRK